LTLRQRSRLSTTGRSHCERLWLDGGKLDLRELRELWDQMLATNLVVAGNGERLHVCRARFR